MRKEWDKNPKIVLYGSAGKVGQAVRFFNNLEDVFLGREVEEGEIRLRLLHMLDDGYIDVDILYAGNTVWSKRKILRNLNLIVKSGDMNRMTNYFYEFLHLCCGSIAHFHREGWISVYPTVDDLKAFFTCNEFGRRVYDDISSWHTDAKVIVKEIEKVLGV